MTSILYRLAPAACITAVLALAPAHACAQAREATPGAPASGTAAGSPVPPGQRRGVEQTFLTYPEWFLVHSPAEYAAMAATRPAHDFPFMRHIGQLWSSYAAVTREQRRAHYPANPGYHVMIGVIATSTTVEYATRAAYENTAGRIAWATASGSSPEDRYGAAVAQDYVDFIRKEPWYRYDFKRALAGLWTGVPATGPDMIRKWERRYALTTEYLVKDAYGKLIELATRSAYDPALPTTEVVTDRAPDAVGDAQLARAGIKLVRRLDDGRALLVLPRYEAFRDAATLLARHGVRLVDIAGNRSVILVTVRIDGARPLTDGDGRVLFEQPIITVPGRRRVALAMPVARLSAFLRDARARGIEVEHVYDY